MASVRNSLLVHPAGKPLAAVDPHLQSAWQPALKSGAHHAKLTIKPVFVNMQASAPFSPKFKLFGFAVSANSIRVARFHASQHAHEPFPSTYAIIGQHARNTSRSQPLSTPATRDSFYVTMFLFFISIFALRVFSWLVLHFLLSFR